ncbi:MAG: dihydropyrimidinase [Nitrososphaerota archaeon]|nr:dihydropyrimidinase [Nitrososphaerota archaeon]
MAFDFVVRNARLVTGSDSFDSDIGVKDGRIASLSHSIDAGGAKSYDASGKIIVPGAIDGHTHMEFPFMGATSADDFYDGTVAAACGGTTSIVDFVLPSSGETILEALAQYRKKADPKVVVDYGLHMIFKGANMGDIEQIPEVVAQGASSFKLFTTYRKEGLMLDDIGIYKAMKKVSESGGLIAVHAENNGIIENLVEANLGGGNTQAKYHAMSKPAAAEAEAVTRAASLARVAGAPMYVVHLSSRAGRDAVRLARASGTSIFAETCPHYLVLSAEAYDGVDGRNFVMSPPLRSKDDNAALWVGLQPGGTIETVGSDHCPFPSAQKDIGKDDFTKTPNGVPGTEAILPILYSEGVRKGRISLFDMVRVTSSGPAKNFGLFPRKGSLMVGSDADFVVIDPEKKVRMTADAMHTKIDYSIYDHFTTEGYPVLTVSRGEVVMENGNFIGRQGRGKFLRRGRTSTRT